MPAETPDCAAMIALFNSLFADTENTRLHSGGDEPIYLPADAETPWHRIIFRDDYVASALHEIAHWCVAGEERRLLTDFGYWYAPDGRTAVQQRVFEKVEAKPQALEWVFNVACGRRFRPSVDNLGGEPTDPQPFREAIVAEVASWYERGLPSRALRFTEALTKRWGDGRLPQPAAFTQAAIGG